jgi:NAD(P)-dependent dehydrogenase (short-subunit alcohol dehydrogenase family)
MSGRLAGLGAIVTGATGGIGAAIVERFIAEGAAVVGLDIAVPAGMGSGPLIQCDVGNAADVERGMEAALTLLDGRLDVLVTAAALTGGRGTFPDVTDAEWQGYVDINLSGTFYACRAAARAMIARGRGGSLITVGSINSISAEPNALPYVASKGGVALLTRAMAVDLGRHGIRANMLAPGPTEVPRNAALFNRPEVAKFLKGEIPLGVIARPDDVANAAVFLAEPGSKLVTGTTLVVDGGQLARVGAWVEVS